MRDKKINMKLILEGQIQNGGSTPPPTGYNQDDCSKTGDTTFMDTHDCYVMDVGGAPVCFFKDTSSTTTTTTNSGITMPNLSDLKGLITNAIGEIKSWFGTKVDESGEWMKKTFTKSDIEKAQEECYKVPFKDEDSAKKSLESGDILDYYQLKDTSGNTIFLGKAWDCENKGGTPPCFKNLSGGKFNPENQSYTEEYFEELDDAGVYEYYCNGSVSLKPYYESDATGGYVESDRPKVWYKWDPKTGVINKS